MLKFIKTLFSKKKHQAGSQSKDTLRLSKSVTKNLQFFRELLTDDDLIIYREFEHQGNSALKYAVIFVNGMVNDETINENIIAPLIEFSFEVETGLKESLLDFLIKKILISAKVRREKVVEELINAVLYGNTMLLVEGVAEALLIDTSEFKHRPISEPRSESVVRGSREGFTESILINISLIRRRLTCMDLKLKMMKIGERTHTQVCLCYLEGVAHPKIVAEVLQRLQKIKIDAILESNYIVELIKDAPLSPFATIYSTERPDIVVANLLEGRVALIVDGTPFALTMPCLFIEFFQANEDYYTNFLYASFNRLLRFGGFFLATSLPAIYVALTTYHQEMIPTALLLNISAAREGMPFPTVIEALFMTLIFDFLKESGVRLPSPIGSTIGFVGAIIVGQSSVTAKMVSAPIVIIAAITGISNFLTPKILGPIIFMRLFLLILSSILGLYGYIFGVVAITIHLMSMRSFGVPYMSPLTSFKIQEIKDTAFRAPWWLMNYRPKLIGDRNPVRQKKSEQQSEGSE